MVKNIDQFIDKLLSGFNPKVRKVIAGRFGLRNGKKATLQEIGDELGITRERVRQIEEQALKKLNPLIKGEAAPTLEFAAKYLAGVGDVRRDDYFLLEVKHSLFPKSNVKYLDQKLRFIFLTGGKPLYYKEDDLMRPFWYSNDGAKKKFFEFAKHMTNFFKTSDKKEILDDKIHLKECGDFHKVHFLSIPKDFGINVFGDVGLRVWPEIAPNTVRDKAYLVLRKYGAPLHFEDIATYVSRYGLDKKPAHVQTVHNELIKDNRFVLVGRGMYALREQGFEPGTVREVIARILKTKGPLVSEEVVNMVNKQRILKENTILLSLQNRRFFKRLDDGRYHVKEA